jgi:hypothetical protein
MISNEAELRQATQQLEHIFVALADTKAHVYAKNPSLFALLAEGPLKTIDELQSEIDEFTGRKLALEWIETAVKNRSS